MSGVFLGNANSVHLLQFTFDPGSVSAATTAEQTVTVNGLKVGDFAVVSKPSLSAGVGIANVRVSAANTLTITYVNATAGAVNPASETYTLLVIRPEGTPLPTKLIGA